MVDVEDVDDDGEIGYFQVHLIEKSYSSDQFVLSFWYGQTWMNNSIKKVIRKRLHSGPGNLKNCKSKNSSNKMNKVHGFSALKILKKYSDEWF